MVGPYLNGSLNLAQGLGTQAMMMTPLGQLEPFIGILEIAAAAQKQVSFLGGIAQPKDLAAGQPGLADGPADAILFADPLDITFEGASFSSTRIVPVVLAGIAGLPAGSWAKPETGTASTHNEKKKMFFMAGETIVLRPPAIKAK